MQTEYAPRRSNCRFRRVGTFLLLLFVFAHTGGVQALDESGEPVDFVLERLDGGTSSLSDFRGQWVVLNYWATWCAPCRAEIPELSELHVERDDISVLGLAYEEAEKSEFEAFLAEFKPAYPMLLVDVYAPPEPFGVPRVLPTTYILNPRGRVVKAFAGPVTRAHIEATIDSLSSDD